MESSIAEFLTRRLASEQPPTRAARRHHARPPLSSPLPSRPSPCPPCPRAGRDQVGYGGGRKAGRGSATIPFLHLAGRCGGIPSRPFGYDQV